ncbi:uncharacterized protein LOC126842599 [Adelges cooleyi]|uniref:uncharacterized protein LOC126842599 n=1 Tax=Adelges cooleyi TaxID=133065 RepID=UPI0021804C64|nr:uncharacterized protein LOC126842599 [Adelges cooleyi]
MKRSTLVVLAAVCLLQFKSSDGACPNAPVEPDKSQPLVALLSTLCSTSTLNALPEPALGSIVNTLSTNPQLFGSLTPDALLTLLNAVASSPGVLNQVQPAGLLALLAAISSASPSAIGSLPRSVVYPLLNTLSASGLLPKLQNAQSSAAPTFVAKLPPLPAPPRQVIVPGPAHGPMMVTLPKKAQRPRPIFIPSGPAPSIVVSIPELSPAPPPLIMPQNGPGPIVINDHPGGYAPQPIVVPAPEPPSIYFTTYPAKSCSQAYYNPATGQRYPQYYFQSGPNTPKVFLTTLPPGVQPPQCASSPPSPSSSLPPLTKNCC